MAGIVAEKISLQESRTLQSSQTPLLTHLAELAVKTDPQMNPCTLFYLRGADAVKGAGFAVARKSESATGAEPPKT